MIRLFPRVVELLLRGFFRLRAAASLAVFDEPGVLSLPRRPVAQWQSYLRNLERRKDESIQKFMLLVTKDPELAGIIAYYQLTDEDVRRIIGLLIRCALPMRHAIVIPFVLEMCAFILRQEADVVEAPDKQGRAEHAQSLIRRAYQTPRFVDEHQRHRFVEIFGASAVREKAGY
jgi:hypothetical protein